MRILFKKGKQKELIKKFKIKNKMTWNQMANSLKIKEGRLKAYNDETSLIPDFLANSIK